MAATQQEKLKRAILIVSEWTRKRMPNEIEILFDDLRYYDQTKDVDLWKQLREAMVENSELLYDDLQEYIYEPVLATNGWWWYDRNMWKEKSE